MKYVSSKRFSGVQLYQKNDGDIIYYIRYKNLAGTLIREKIGSKSSGITEIFCNQKRNDILNKLRLGEEVKTKYHQKQKVKFEEVWKYFLDNRISTDKRKNELYGIWENHLKDYFEFDVTIEKLQEFRKNKKRNLKTKTGLAPKTLDMRISEISTAITFWNKNNLHKNFVNVVTQLRAMDQDLETKKEIQARDIKRDRYLTKDEVSTLKEYLYQNSDEDLSLFVAISLSTGARLVSTLSICKKDINDNKVILKNHKTGGGTYTGFLNKECTDMLQIRLPNLNKNDSIFYLQKNQIQKRLQRILNKLFNEGLDTKDSANRVVVHTLRHTFASRLVENGVPLIKVKKLLDHGDISTTMRYSHLAPDSGMDDVMTMWN